MQIESENDEVDRFFSLVEDLEENHIQEKKLLIMKFISGPLKPGQPTEFALTGEKRLVFGDSTEEDIVF